MLTCPFCGFDYTEEGLREGRCPSCGGVLAWEDSLQTMATGDFVEPSHDADHEPNPMPPAVPSASPTADDSTLVDSHEPRQGDSPQRPAIDVTSAKDTTRDEEVAPDSDHSTDPDIPATVVPRDLSPGQQRHMTAMWAGVLAGGETPDVTIKSTAALAEVAAHLVVRPRTVVRSGDYQTGPADYELIETIGEGGVGVVYSARQASVDRTVAVKMLKAGMDSKVDREKFLAEAVVTGDLDHPNIVPVHDLGSDKQGALFYSMKQVVGTPWSQAIQKKTQAENIEILMKVCDAIAFAHARGVIHRDIKPENVMLGDFGEVLVMDWGIALSTSLMEKAKDASAASSMGGTPAYMAPEMATGPLESIGTTSDVYLLGAILFEIISGKPPHTGRDVKYCLLAAARNEIRPTRQSGELLEIAYKALSTRPRDRYASVKDFQDAVRQYQSHTESISLTVRADEGLEEAKHSDDYQDYSRAAFAFEEALSLWDGNSKASEGVARAKLAYAASAHRKGDFDLGLSLLAEDVPEHASLRQKLRAAIRERDTRARRLRNMKRIAGLLLAIVLAGGTVAFALILVLYGNAKSERGKAMAAKSDAERLQGVAETLRDEALKEKDRADQQRELADEQRKNAEREREKAEDERRRAIAARRRETESSYKAEIRLAAENIANDDFDGARKLLLEHENSPKRKLRHWEWGRLSHRCRLDRLTLDTRHHEFGPQGSPVETVAQSPDQRLIAVGTSGGWIYVWRKPPDTPWADGAAEAAYAVDVGSPVFSLAFSHNGTSLAIGGGTDRQGVVKIWEFPAAEENVGEAGLPPPRDISSQCGHHRRVTCISFSADDQLLLTGSEDRTARLLAWRSETRAREFRGHFDTVWSVAFSNDPNQRWIVSASEDGTVRIWDRESGATVQRFQEHVGPVYSAVFSPDNRHVASGGYDKQVLLWEFLSETKLREFELAQKRGENLGDLARESFIEEVENRLQGDPPPPISYRKFSGHRAAVRRVCFSRFGGILISGSQDHTLKVWDTGLAMDAAIADPSGADREQRIIDRLREQRDGRSSTGSLLLTLRGHGGWVHSCALSADGETVLSGSYDMTAKLWDLTDYREFDVFRSNSGRPVLAAAMAPDGRYIAAAYDDGTATFWKLGDKGQSSIQPSGDEPRLVEGHDYLVSNAVFSRDGSLLFTAGGDNTVRIWKVDQGTQIVEIADTGRRGILAISPDARWILTGSTEKKAVLWEWEPGSKATLGQRADLDHAEPIRQQLSREFPQGDEDELEKRVPDVTAVCISPDARLAFTGDANGGCWLWELPGGRLRHQRAGRGERINAAKFTPDGRYVLTAGADHTVLRWDVDTGREASGRLKHPGPVTDLDVMATEDETYVLTTCAVRSTTGARDRTGRIPVFRWRLGSDQPLASMVIPAERINSIAFSPDGRRALVAASNNRLWVWDFDRNERELVWNDKTPRGAISRAMFSPEKDENRVLTVGGDGARLWDGASGHRVMTYRPHDAAGSVNFSADGKYVITASIDGSAKIWSYRDGDGGVRAVCKLEGGGDDDRGTHRGHTGPLTVAVFHPHPGNQTVLTAGSDGTAKLWEQVDAANDTWKVTHTYSNPGDARAAVRDAVFSPDGTRVLTVSDDGLGRIWDVENDNVPSIILKGHTQAVLCGRFSPDGKWAMTGGEDRTVIFFDAKDGRRLTSITDLTVPVSTMAISPDCQRLLIGKDKSVGLWDAKPLCERMARVADGEGSQDELGAPTEIMTLEAHTGPVTSAAFSPRGRHVITSSLDGTTILWEGELVEASVELSLDVIDYLNPSKVIEVAPNAQVRDPSSVDFDGGVLEIQLRNPNGPGPSDTEWLDVGAGGVGDPRITVEAPSNPKLDREVIFDGGSGPLKIATYRGPVNGGAPLSVDLTSEAGGLSLEALVHSITYRNDTLGDTDAERLISVVLRDGAGRTGNYEKSLEERMIRIGAEKEALDESPDPTRQD